MATTVELECPIFSKIGAGSAGVMTIGANDRRIQFNDDVNLYFGNAQDIDIRWDGTDLDILPVANNTVIKVGNGTLSCDVWVYGSAAANYIEWDASANTLYLRGANCVYQQGASASVTGSGVALSATKTAAMSVFSDDGNAAIASSVLTRAGRFRNLQTYTGGNREQEAAGLIGQLVSVAGTNRHNMCGLMGSYEASTSLTVDGQAWSTDPWIQAGVIARVGVGTAITTVNANGILAGLAAMSNTVSFSAQNGIYAGLYVGSWAGTVDWQYGVYIQGGAVSRAFQAGEQANTAGSGVTLNATYSAAMQVFTDDGNAAIASSVLTRAGRFRNLQVYTAGNREQEATGVIGQLVSVAGTNRHNMCGVMGSYEAATSLTVDGQASSTDPWVQAGVIGRVGVGSAITTINANGKLAGLAAMSNTASFSANNGVYAGLYVGRWGSNADWGYGIYLENVDVGIQFAHTLTPDGTRTNRAIGIGSRATEMDVTMAASTTQHLDPIQVNLNVIGSNPTGSSTLNTFYALITHDTTDMSNMRLKNSDWNIVVGKDVLDVYCYQGEVDFNASGIAVGGEAAVLGLTLAAGANAVTGNLWGAIIVTTGAGLPAATSAALFLSHRGGTLARSIYIEANSSQTITSAMYINPAGTVTNFLEIANLTGGPAAAYSAAGTGAYSIKCKINGVTTYIHTYDSA